MKIARKPRPAFSWNVTSFSDIAFLLIIFFILTTTLTQSLGRTMEIPSGTTEESPKDAEHPTVVLTADGILYGTARTSLSPEGLREALDRERLRARPEADRIVILESAPDVTYERYFQAVMAITGAGGVIALLEEEAP